MSGTFFGLNELRDAILELGDLWDEEIFPEISEEDFLTENSDEEPTFRED